MGIGTPNGRSPFNDIAYPMSLSRRPQTFGERVWKLLDNIEFELLALVVFSLIAWTLSLTVGMGFLSEGLPLYLPGGTRTAHLWHAWWLKTPQHRAGRHGGGGVAATWEAVMRASLSVPGETA
ncbi:hypothetical protein HaLaN_07586 [Haematococcus lacustris]|uniref:Uncharacterized protein n=1 Tax=Haematococcus lacustris TaxID=44745 RepID=A0A699YZD0_HAELA|nr:hypothetical protein HaLaN_07586 [Haematococcus lacustris]